MDVIKAEGGWLYRGVFIAKQKSGFSFTVLNAEHNSKGNNWNRLLPDTLTVMKANVDQYLSAGAVVANRKIQKVVA